MARYEIPDVVQDLNGVAVVGASVQINTRSGNPATVYAAETGTGTLANPLTTGSQGRIDGWLEEGSYRASVTGTGIASFTQNIEAVIGDGASLHAAGSVSLAALTSAVAQALVPAGSVLAYGGATAPTGYVLAQGQLLVRADYPALFAALSTTYNTGGETSLQFRLPDYRGRVLIGLGTQTEISDLSKNDGIVLANRKIKHKHGKGSIGASGGSHTHAKTETAHVHGVTDPGHSHSTQMTNGFGAPSGQSNAYTQENGGVLVSYFAPSSTNPTGVSVNGAVSNVVISAATHTHLNAEFSGEVGDLNGPLDSPAYHVVNYIIKV